MKRFLALLAITLIASWLVAGAAFAQTATCAFQFGVTPYSFDIDANNYAAVYFCPGKYTWTFQYFSGPVSDLTTFKVDLQNAINSQAAFADAYKRNVTGPETDPARGDMVNALIAAHRPADPVWAVASLFGSTTRPTFPVVNGIRSTTKNGNIVVGLTCDCKALAIDSGTRAYCSVAGKPDAMTSTPLPIGTVSLCAHH